MVIQEVERLQAENESQRAEIARLQAIVTQQAKELVTVLEVANGFNVAFGEALRRQVPSGIQTGD